MYISCSKITQHFDASQQVFNKYMNLQNAINSTKYTSSAHERHTQALATLKWMTKIIIKHSGFQTPAIAKFLIR